MTSDSFRKILSIYLFLLLFILSIIATTAIVRGVSYQYSKTVASVVNLAGKQRMYAQQIASFAAQRQLGNKAILGPLKNTIADFKKNQEDLAEIAQVNNLRDLITEYANPNSALNRATNQYIKTAEIISNTHNINIHSNVFSTLYAMANTQILTRLDQVVSIFEAQLNHKTQRYNIMIELLRIVLVILILVLTGILFKHAHDSKSEIEAGENKLASIIEGVKDYAIFMLDAQGYIQSWNKGAERIKGYTVSEIIGQHFSIFYTQEDLQRQHPQQELAIAKQTGRYQEEGWRICKDRKKIWVDVLMTARYNEHNDLIGFSQIVKDLTERRRLETMKNEFVSVVSHELRTPLTAIRGSIGLLLGGTLENHPEKSRNLLEIADKNCERLLHLINDILDFEKISSSKINFNCQMAELGQIVENAVVMNQAFANQFSIPILLTKKVTPCYANVDIDRVMQVLTNLISNAVKFSDKNTPVEIQMVKKNNRIRVEVMNHGAGIPESFRAKMFERFSQVDSTLSRQKGGTGLGLSISKMIIEKMNGNIDYNSIENKTTTFFFELPLDEPTYKKKT